MKVFDLHADIACAINKYNSKENCLKNNWSNKLKDGEIYYTCAASFFDGSQSWEEMTNIVDLVDKNINDSHFNKILTKEDIKEYDDLAFLMTIEGMCGIKDNVLEKIDWLYAKGNRIGSLCWNDENALATGNDGSPSRGLTALGKEAIKRMNELHFIVDVSHANEHTFYDILDESSLPIIATHSNAKKLCFVERNLTDQQIKAIANKDGLIGMNACPMFIDDDLNKDHSLNLAKHAYYIANLIGVKHVCCGFDFSEYYSNREYNSNLKGPSQAQNFISALKEVGFNKEEIEAIAYKNVFEFLKKYL